MPALFNFAACPATFIFLVVAWRVLGSSLAVFVLIWFWVVSFDYDLLVNVLGVGFGLKVLELILCGKEKIWGRSCVYPQAPELSCVSAEMFESLACNVSGENMSLHSRPRLL